MMWLFRRKKSEVEEPNVGPFYTCATDMCKIYEPLPDNWCLSCTVIELQEQMKGLKADMLLKAEVEAYELDAAIKKTELQWQMEKIKMEAFIKTYENEG